jgi:hypothetical protein
MHQTLVHQTTLKNTTGLKSTIDSNTMIVGDFSISVSPIGRSSRQKPNKVTLELIDTIDHMVLIGIYRVFR